jgi:hypothetical protein
MKRSKLFSVVSTFLFLAVAACNEAVPSPGEGPAATESPANEVRLRERLHEAGDPGELSPARATPETSVKCTYDGECDSCCTRSKCCMACGGGPVVCT